jgi:DNA adenine methylase
MQFSSDIAVANGFKTRASRSPAQTFDNARERIHELADRFRDVIIECRDYKKILQGYDDDSVDVLFYLDPPYVDGKNYYPIEFDHSEFAEALLKVENDWMVSYSEIPDCLVAAMIGAVREESQEFYVLNRNRRHRMDRENSDSEEHLICNFDPSKRSSFVGEGVSQQTLDTIQ